jgi:membrane-bound lytic murein transglycosylase B
MLALAAPCALARAALADTPSASGTDTAAFVARLWPTAETRGISRAVFDRATAGLALDLEVAALAAAQPEQQRSVGDYVSELVTAERIARGQQLAAEHAALLEGIEKTYGVDRHLLLAIWGIESAYGSAMGSRHVIRSLVSLAMLDRRRAPYWTSELLAALRVLQGGAAPERLVGSWAGAMGHTQFMPSTFLAHAVDFDRDGRRDIWGSVADALASSANFLRASGWSSGVAWGYEVILPPGFDYAWAGPGRLRTLTQWRAAGLQPIGRAGAIDHAEAFRLILPAGARGPAFLVSGNFGAILKYNPSSAYALAVGHLADRLAGRGPLTAPWPPDKPLARAEREELQRMLVWHGLDTGGLDGIIGDQTQAAIRATQRRLNLVEDGHPNLDLLLRLRSTGAP